MRVAAAVVLGLLVSVTPVPAMSKDACYKASRGIVFDLFEGHYEHLGTPPPGGWTRWIADEFPSDTAFRTFAVVEEELLDSGCQARIKLETVGGRVFALFIDLDGELRPTALRSLSALLADRTEQLDAAVGALREALPQVAKGSADDVHVVALLKRVRSVTRDSDRDISNFIVILEGPQVQLPRRPSPLFGAKKVRDR